MKQFILAFNIMLVLTKNPFTTPFHMLFVLFHLFVPSNFVMQIFRTLGQPILGYTFLTGTGEESGNFFVVDASGMLK
jgi:hypothetical protein